MKKPTKEILLLQERIKPYSEFWYEWLHSPACFLTKEQIDVILLVQHYRDYKKVGEIMGRPYGGIVYLLHQTSNRLCYRSSIRKYNHWVADKMLEDAGAYEGFTPLERFLCTPIYYFKLRNILEYGLTDMGNTIGEVLENYNEKEMLEFRNFGMKKLSMFKKFLKENNALHLLRRVRKKRRKRSFA